MEPKPRLPDNFLPLPASVRNSTLFCPCLMVILSNPPNRLLHQREHGPQPTESPGSQSKEWAGTGCEHHMGPGHWPGFPEGKRCLLFLRPSPSPWRHRARHQLASEPQRRCQAPSSRGSLRPFEALKWGGEHSGQGSLLGMILSGLRARLLVPSMHERGPRGALTALRMGPQP